ncbi:Acid stress chaperone HdeB [Klebsiella pneumoniae]|nr:Acid stress chaperone HdeB [Klebsiella pneumoniae]
MNLPKALVLTVAATTFCLMTSPAFAVEETTPQNMTCQEFMDMNPKSMTPVAFWVVNRNTDFSGGDYVDWHEVETVSVPKMLQECHKNPAAKLGDLSAVIKNTPASGRETRRAAAGPAYSSIPHSHGRWRPISLRYKNAPIIAPTTGASSGTRK